MADTEMFHPALKDGPAAQLLEELPQLRSPCHLGPHPCRAAHTRWYKAWPLWPPGGWVMLAPKLPPSLAEALWHLHRDWTSPSAWGCFCPFLSQVFIPSHHLVLRMRVTSICSQTPQPVTVSGCACVKSCVGEGCKAVAWASPSKCSSLGTRGDVRVAQCKVPSAEDELRACSCLCCEPAQRGQPGAGRSQRARGVLAALHAIFFPGDLPAPLLTAFTSYPVTLRRSQPRASSLGHTTHSAFPQHIHSKRKIRHVTSSPAPGLPAASLGFAVTSVALTVVSMVWPCLFLTSTSIF